jgi:hypothetical protein
MLDLLRIALGSLLANLRSRRDLAIENLALRQQVAVLRRAARKPRLSDADTPSAPRRPTAVLRQLL